MFSEHPFWVCTHTVQGSVRFASVRFHTRQSLDHLAPGRAWTVSRGQVFCGLQLLSPRAVRIAETHPSQIQTSEPLAVGKGSGCFVFLGELNQGINLKIHKRKTGREILPNQIKENPMYGRQAVIFAVDSDRLLFYQAGACY